jgi:3-hydroxybutyryl-CoA dehydrogenase
MAIRKVFIAGAGEMGRGIAQAAAAAGIGVTLSDLDEAKLKAGLEGIGAVLDESIGRWAITAAEKKAILARIKPVVGLIGAEDCDFAIEAVPEELEIKKSVFAGLDRVCPARTILVTTTSTLSITDIGSFTARPDRIVGMHFLFPVPQAAMVELVRALKTSDETLASAKDLATKMGKEIVEVYEYPGFITTRVMIPYINEAAYVLMEGVASAVDIDRAMKLGFGLPMGPLELADTIGLDVLMRLMERLFRELGDMKFKPCPLLRRMVREGRLGKKTGEGFLSYADQGERRL